MIWIWIAFIVFVLLMLALDLGVFHRRAHVVTVREALAWSSVWLTLSLTFAVFVYFAYDSQWFGLGIVADAVDGLPNDGSTATEKYLAGYIVEKSLSVDQGGDLILDAQGDANAVWVFQMASTLLVGGPGVASPQSVILINGAQAKNVFWQAGSAATINAGGGGTMVGTIISPAGTTFSTAGNVTPTTLNGRVLSTGASITMVNAVINVPAP